MRRVLFKNKVNKKEKTTIPIFQFLAKSKTAKRAGLKIFAGKMKGSFLREPLFYLTIAFIFCLFFTLCFGLDSFSGNFSVLKADMINSGDLLFAESPKNFLLHTSGMALVGENSAIGISSPISITTQVLGSYAFEESRNEIIEHIVSEGETISSIAENYGISPETILWTNDLSSKTKLKEGQKIIILPISGVLHSVVRGDTLSGIADIYKVKASEIVAFNDLGEEDIYIGDILIIPGGKMPSKPKASLYASIPIGTSYFICPHINCHITQQLHYYNAIDFGGKCGDPVYASASGIVQKIDFGWNNGGGNNIRIEHPNGAVTYYGHIQKALVSVGQKVSQGEIIALMGGKPGTPGAGISTGCHVHFAVIGAKNPFAK
ncbi:MAG: hypothetical protein A2365_01450 [Candidatus Nealsonbacteria bacterium RIFOXYB1_FULL_40_15]|uniref:LysM domain-containing protein n=2 Tax=Candidatus Nealsoniibacteriota TaxID=1817911 RepID=A0A1G2ESE0_9BACT|nr:MAG: hypothetical protein A2365_01450 [Candidatus Nealsonbacteria bacterium RIFOXYB1_FULL_40_15]OGZ28270.1 MAG: hypothetical protein A2427_04810 [Candidatus Nealsonbacteria bacterium RIFOXYC1_FULL_40_7]OGZ29417.1 MAG: hypothetical protein A2562_04285 [Candidatus Nealsonbacteria bacterium RIFOXYD1_FULL_39_11]